MLKDGFHTDRGSHSDLWSSSSSLESSGFPLPKQYLDVSSQTDISGSVSRRRVLLRAPKGQRTLLVTHLRSRLVTTVYGPGCNSAFWSSVLLQTTWPPDDMR